MAGVSHKPSSAVREMSGYVTAVAARGGHSQTIDGRLTTQQAMSDCRGHLQTFLVGKVLVRFTLKVEIAAWTARPRSPLTPIETRETNA